MQKKFLFLTMMVTLLAGFNGCKTEKKNEPVQPSEESAAKPHWDAVSTPDYSASMTLICVPPKGETTSSDDELAAFLNGVCCRLATLQDGVFYLGVPGPESEMEMELRYYSSTRKTIRTLTMTYMPDGRLGSADVPYQLDFTAAAPQRIVLHGSFDEVASAPWRANIGGDDGSKLNLYWRKDDKIRLQKNDGTDNSELTISKGINNQCADFTGWGDIGTGYYVTCPTSATYANGTISYSIPAVQSYVTDNYANGLMPMYGSVELNETTHTYDQFSMTPIATALCLQLTGSRKVTSITLNAGETLIAGSFATTGSDITGGAGTSITLSCGEGVQLNSTTPTKFIFVLPAVTLPVGTTFTVHCTEGVDKVQTTQTALTLGQGKYVPLKAFSID